MTIQKAEIGKAEVTACDMSKTFIEQEENEYRSENIDMNNTLEDIFHTAEEKHKVKCLHIFKEIYQKLNL